MGLHWRNMDPFRDSTFLDYNISSFLVECDEVVQVNYIKPDGGKEVGWSRYEHEGVKQGMVWSVIPWAKSPNDVKRTVARCEDRYSEKRDEYYKVEEPLGRYLLRKGYDLNKVYSDVGTLEERRFADGFYKLCADYLRLELHCSFDEAYRFAVDIDNGMPCYTTYRLYLDRDKLYVYSFMDDRYYRDMTKIRPLFDDYMKWLVNIQYMWDGKEAYLP